LNSVQLNGKLEANKMARRSDHSREELYELALGAAQNIVEQDGFRALTARNVADAIGYSPGTLYNLFENLDGLIVHLNGRTLDSLHECLASAAVVGVPEQDIKALLEEYLGYLEKSPNLWSALFEYSLPKGVTLPEWYRLKVSKVMGLVEDALNPLFGEHNQDNVSQAARILWASLHGICSLSDTGKLAVVTATPVRQMAEGLVENFVAGLKVNLGRTNS
jgi:AcrR family transcriptional regulator